MAKIKAYFLKFIIPCTLLVIGWTWVPLVADSVFGFSLILTTTQLIFVVLVLSLSIIIPSILALGRVHSSLATLFKTFAEALLVVSVIVITQAIAAARSELWFVAAGIAGAAIGVVIALLDLCVFRSECPSTLPTEACRDRTDNPNAHSVDETSGEASK